MSTILNGDIYLSLVASGAENLRNNASIVNDLNVFPIPDGDTGENMSMTIFGGVRALQSNQDNSIANASKTLANGMLLSARGNSGVILSQFFAGIAEGFAGITEADVHQVGNAFTCGVKTAYSAVINPTEGTILTVAREAVEFANKQLDEKSTIESFFTDCLKEMKESLQRTPDLLACLKEAGVIDSGGAGLLYIFDGIDQALNGHSISNDVAYASNTNQSSIDLTKFNEDSVMEFGYCTEFLLQLQKCKIDISSFDINELIGFLNSVGGDSIVAVQNGSIVKIHVHTLNPGMILQHCQKYGEFLTIKIENMTLQHNDTTIQNRFSDVTKKRKVEERKPFATITVASGEGIKQTFLDLGASLVIEGGQTQNPSTESFVEAFDKVNADTIFVLPNNSNIIMAAKQAASLYSKSKVYVIESKNIGDGYSALSMLDYSSNDVDTIIASMKDAMADVVTGQVTHSVRDANINSIEIKKNDYIGFTDKTMLSANEDKMTVVYDLLHKMKFDEKEVLISIYGCNVTEEEKDALRKHVKETYPRKEMFEIEGQQDIYEFLLII